MKHFECMTEGWQEWQDTIDTKSQRKIFSIFENINQENTSEHAIHVFNKEKMFEVKCHNDFINIYS